MRVLFCRVMMRKTKKGRGDNREARFVDQSNPSSNRAYKNIGFEIVEDRCDFLFGKEESI